MNRSSPTLPVALLFGLAVAVGCDDGAAASPSPAPTTPSPGPVAPHPQTQNPQPNPQGSGAWPPSGAGCAELIACCDGLATDAQLFCRLSVATPPVDCGASLGRVVTYLGERGSAVPPTCQPAGGGAGGGPSWVQLSLPEVDGWQRQAPQDHGPEQGYVVEYLIPDRATVSVYVYRGGVQNITRAPAMLTSEVDRALAGIQQAVQIGRYDEASAMGPTQMGTLGGIPNGPPAAHQRVGIRSNGATILSDTYVTTHRGFFFKLRISIYVEPTPELASALERLYAALAAVPVES